MEITSEHFKYLLGMSNVEEKYISSEGYSIDSRLNRESLVSVVRK